MSRLGKKPVAIPDGVKVSVAGGEVVAEGKLGKLTYTHRPEVSIEVDADAKEVVVSRTGEEREHRAFHGLTRALVQNMVVGVSEGYVKKLEIQGVGYLGAIQGDVLQLRVGFANEIQKKIPAGVNVTCPDQTHIVVQGMDKQRVGQFAAEVRAVRKPEPYKGKGIRYEGEQVRRKAGKAAK
ncbi:50S ribosomal protein L6 [Pirellulimonas nuda]|uniref:Large ribosomal subunit protein uL6 n=1 Tax=Pirellulimonas nuda TaxID=2528009 RepID=A0A518DIK0_9BACT|nr:50S ribosomal protein L6 [Pirellulimonas nuda]QDU91294.1 50S ribosomal protein L6 [Pirellulimonas nuda]